MSPKVLDRNIVKIDPELCKGCSLCVEACPENVIEISDKFNSKGYHYAVFLDNGKCTGCGLCYYACPELDCVTVIKKGYVMEETGEVV